MKQILVVGEDALCCELGLKLVRAAMPGWAPSEPPINTKGVTKLKTALPRYAQQAKHVRPVLCIADTDARCPVAMLEEFLPEASPSNLLLRLAVPEAESWVLADRDAFATCFQVSLRSVPTLPEQLVDAKAEVLRLARISKVRRIREEVVSTGKIQKQGAGYNAHLAALVRHSWDVSRARERAPSLERAVGRLGAFASR